MCCSSGTKTCKKSRVGSFSCQPFLPPHCTMYQLCRSTSQHIHLTLTNHSSPYQGRLPHNPSHYSFHTFRHSGTTLAFPLGEPIDHIQAPGTWRSQAVWSYLNLDSTLAVSPAFSALFYHQHLPLLLGLAQNVNCVIYIYFINNINFLFLTWTLRVALVIEFKCRTRHTVYCLPTHQSWSQSIPSFHISFC